MTDDPGLQPQRTTLAWTRTAVGAAALSGLLARHAALTGAAADVAATVLAASAAVCLLVLARVRRDRILAAVAVGRSPIPVRSTAVVTGLIVAVALCVTVGFLADPA